MYVAGGLDTLGSTEKLNDEYTYRYNDVHICKIKLIEITPDKRAVWLVVDNFFSFTKDKSEWHGTTIFFDKSEQNNKTQLSFNHHGLVAEYECFYICTNACTKHIQQSLQSLITTGKDLPNTKQSKPRP